MKLKELFFEDVKEGDEVNLTKDPITRTQIVQYAGASGDFNPMHHDERMAVAVSQVCLYAERHHGLRVFGNRIPSVE